MFSSSLTTAAVFWTALPKYRLADSDGPHVDRQDESYDEVASGCLFMSACSLFVSGQHWKCVFDLSYLMTLLENVIEIMVVRFIVVGKPSGIDTELAMEEDSIGIPHVNWHGGQLSIRTGCCFVDWDQSRVNLPVSCTTLGLLNVSLEADSY